MKLSTVLKFKLACTLCLWALPALFYNSHVAGLFSFPEPQPRVWIHLLGAAYLALGVGYEFARREHARGRDVRYVIAMGVTSNALASLILWVFGLTGAWSGWNPKAQAYMWASALLTLLITVGLVATRRQAFARGSGAEV